MVICSSYEVIQKTKPFQSGDARAGASFPVQNEIKPVGLLHRAGATFEAEYENAESVAHQPAVERRTPSQRNRFMQDTS